jgi:hypothetical protein
MAKPSGWLYLVGIGVAFGGCGASLALGLGGMKDKVEGMQRAVMPGQATLELPAGEQVGYYEHKSVVEGAVFATGELSGMTCQLRDPQNAVVPLESMSLDLKYELGSHAGTGMFKAKVPAAGKHTLECRYDQGEGTRVVIAIGEPLTGSILMTVLPGLGAGILGLIICIVIFVKRRRG